MENRTFSARGSRNLSSVLASRSAPIKNRTSSQDVAKIGPLRYGGSQRLKLNHAEML